MPASPVANFMMMSLSREWMDKCVPDAAEFEQLNAAVAGRRAIHPRCTWTSTGESFSRERGYCFPTPSSSAMSTETFSGTLIPAARAIYSGERPTIAGFKAPRVSNIRRRERSRSSPRHKVGVPPEAGLHDPFLDRCVAYHRGFGRAEGAVVELLS